jgi:hypothetical protein
MQELILTNNTDRNFKSLLTELGEKADKIRIVSAFFSDTEFIIDWLDKAKKVDLLVSLRPPTNYYSIKTVYPKLGINIQFLGNDFHSKFYIFYVKGQPSACIIGSSNFTSGGLHKNIETNAILTDTNYLTAIERDFTNLWEQSFLLQPTDLDNYKSVFDNFQKRQEQTEKEQDELQRKILTKRTTEKTKTKIINEAKQYFSFWRVVDEVKEMVREISENEYPGIPVYIAIDHFWHWVKTVWSKQDRPKPSINNRKLAIQKLFKEYCDWDKSQNNYTAQMAKTSKSVFARLLSENNIDNLSTEQAVEIFSNLHSTGRTIKQFHADKKFIEANSIQQIRKSFKYLLYSNDDIGLRIHNLLTSSDYKLKFLASSGIQEINGWTKPNEYPIRNDKADEAVELLGFKIE